MIIRQATVADIPTIRSIAHTTWPVAFRAILSIAQVEYMLERMYSVAALRLQFEQGHQFLLIEQGTGYWGFAGFEHHYSAAGNSRLHKLYVLPGTQGTGAGSLLLDAVIKASRSAGDLQLELNVNRFNSAKDFYLRRGFQVVREEVIDIGNGYVMDDFVLVRSI